VKREVELFYKAYDAAGEGPFWDAQTGLLYWVDILANRIHMMDPVTKKDNIFQLDEPVSVVIPRKNGGVIAAVRNKLCFIDIARSETKVLHELDFPAHVRFNDGKCDAAGRLWVGSMDMNEKEPLGCLYCLDVDLSLREVLRDITISNGLAWSLDNRKMYYIDTPTKLVKAFYYDLEAGQIRDETIAIHFPQDEGVPDGMAIDAEDKLWIAHFYAGKISRWNPENGQCLESYTVPASNVTSCCFGGVALDELFVTSASVALRNPDESRDIAGSLYRLKPDVHGLEAHKFGA